MTFAPTSIIALARVWTDGGGTNLGIVGDTAHQSRGTSYHLGADHLLASAYSADTARDKAGLTNAASALDLGHKSKPALRRFSVWFVARCRTNKPGTRDVREVIYSPDGVKVLRWDRERGFASAPHTGEADNSHLTHTHISFYRDSQNRSKVGLFEPYFAAPPDTSTGGAIVNSYPVPKVPSVIDVASGAVLYTSDAMSASDPDRIIVSPGRAMPYLGAPSTGTRIVEYVDESKVHSGKAYFVKLAQVANVRPAPVPVTDCTAAVAAQKAKDDAALAVVKAALDKATADLATAARNERERIALAEATRIRTI